MKKYDLYEVIMFVKGNKSIKTPAMVNGLVWFKTF